MTVGGKHVIVNQGTGNDQPTINDSAPGPFGHLRVPGGAPRRTRRRARVGIEARPHISSLLAACGDRGADPPVAIATTALAGRPREAAAGYSFQVLAQLGKTAPRNKTLVNDFERRGIDERGNVYFGADTDLDQNGNTTGEGLFVARRGSVKTIGQNGDLAAGGGTFTFFEQGGMNERGDVAAVLSLAPAVDGSFGTNAALYQARAPDYAPTPVVQPFVTLAPPGGTFHGPEQYASRINDAGRIAFPGIFPTANGVHVPGETYLGLGVGIFVADGHAPIRSVVLPGDGAPGGGSFDYVNGPWINGRGDIAFAGHLTGEQCREPPQSLILGCRTTGVYLRRSGDDDGESDARGAIVSIAHGGDPAPSGGIFLRVLAPVLNEHRDVVFAGRLDVPGPPSIGLFLFSDGTTRQVVRPGDPLPVEAIFSSRERSPITSTSMGTATSCSARNSTTAIPACTFCPGAAHSSSSFALGR